jgi:uncharacterized phage protein (predicted DNA packaging)
MTVISLDDAKAHLNLGTDTDDTLLAGQIQAAEAYVSRWLTVPLADMTLVPADLRQAVLMLVGHWYENREATLVGVSADEVPFGVQAIIDQHRAWAF